MYNFATLTYLRTISKTSKASLPHKSSSIVKTTATELAPPLIRHISLDTVNLNWTPAQANGGVICVALQKPFTMKHLCLGGRCYASIFNRDIEINAGTGYCCPLFPTIPL
ncbi:hypothetical protein Vretimale_8580 [Volvox reticuliferus]|uniref:Pherophorin domain-containing protein n=1 Tax=Volvox reticuliferus TaxID=1737510 RepID=A0A8J4LPF9_9CHLO|nr:hypothetical protein Vretifemale_6516 [Volvox reticuliferus]GIM03924.1 hypothetical protein Vretimale_8580 [Volvox reticuliferus]